MNRTWRNSLLGAALVIVGFFAGQPVLVATGLKTVSDTIVEVTNGETNGYVKNDKTE